MAYDKRLMVINVTVQHKYHKKGKSEEFEICPQPSDLNH